MKSTRIIRLRKVCPILCAGLLFLSPVARSADGVRLVDNINTKLIAQSSYPAALGSLNSKLLFGATDVTGPGLWSTDGTTAGTKLLQRLAGQGILANSPWNNVLSIGSRVYFVSTDTGGSSIWVTDGTSAGTSKVVSMPSGSTGTASLLGLFNSMVVISSRDSNNNRQMYVTDGTAAGTQQLTSFSGANEAGVLDGFIVAGKQFYFVAIDSMYNREIWVSDGTVAGTQQVTNGLDGSTATSGAFYNPQSFQLVRGLVLYESDGYLWSIDPSTNIVANVVSTTGMPGFGPPIVESTTLANMGGFILFLGGSGIGPIGGIQLWRSDGTAVGTYEVTEVTANPTSSETQYPFFEQVGNRVVYIGDDGVHGPQLWGSDGTAANTVRLTSAVANPSDYPSQVASPLSVIGSTAYFSLSDGATATTRSVWRTDGTVAGTERLGALPAISYAESGGTRLTGDSNTVFIGTFSGSDDTMSLYKYMPASNSASLVEAGLLTTVTDEFFEMSGRLFFSQNETLIGDEPWGKR